MFERFSDGARRAIGLANQEAQRLHHESIGTEHILLGLIEEGSGVATDILRALCIDLTRLRTEIEKNLPSGHEMVTMGRLPFTPRAKKVIELAFEEARALGHNYVGTEHLLLGLLREREGVGAQALMEQGVTVDDVRAEVILRVGHDLSVEGAAEGTEAEGREKDTRTPYAYLKTAVLAANISLARSGLVVLTFGNVSAADREAGVMAIKPSGMDYGAMKPKDIPVVSLESGEVVDGKLKPSSDTPTHLALYREFETIGGVVHSHSAFATSWAQGGKDIPCFGTTHADFCSGSIPVTRQLTPGEIMRDYEASTGRVIIETLRKNRLTPVDTPAVLVTGHGPFVWGANPREAVENAIILEEIARMAYQTLIINPKAERLPRALHEKHFQRKHGPDAYYGQKGQ